MTLRGTYVLFSMLGVAFTATAFILICVTVGLFCLLENFFL